MGFVPAELQLDKINSFYIELCLKNDIVSFIIYDK